MTRIEEYDVVRLIRASADLGLPAGTKGTVVLTYPESDQEVVEVEFVAADGETMSVATVAVRLLELEQSKAQES